MNGAAEGRVDEVPAPGADPSRTRRHTSTSAPASRFIGRHTVIDDVSALLAPFDGTLDTPPVSARALPVAARRTFSAQSISRPARPR